MITSLTCFLALGLATAQNGNLEIVNARGTYGYLGATRTPSGVMPGETVHFAFDIKGMSQDAKGRVSYSLLMEVLNGKGDKVFQLGPRNAVATNFLGGDTIPCHAHLDVPSDMPPGVNTLRVTITDRNTKRKVVFQKQGKVIPVNFSIVNVGTFADSAGKVPAPPVGVVGESVYVGFSAVGFARNSQNKQPAIELTLKIVDDKGKPTLPQPLKGSVNSGVAPDAKTLEPITVGFTLTRPGNFSVELNAVDRTTGKTSTVRFPLKVTTSP